MFNLLTVEGITIEAATGTNPLIDENGSFVSGEEAISNFKELWEKWDVMGKITSNIPKAILFVVLILVGILVSKLISKIVVKAMKKAKVDASVYIFIKRIISFVVNFAFILMALGLFINVSSFLAAVAAGGVAIALGLQNSVAQFVSGIQILITHQFKSGDYISVDGVEGSVVEIRFMNTVINTVDNKRIIIPNSTMTSNKLINFSAENKRRVDFSFSISYGDDIGKARDVILAVAKENNLILSDPEPVVYVGSHASSSIELITRVWCNTANYWDVFFSMQESVKLAFDKNGISIPFNQLDVHVIDKE